MFVADARQGLVKACRVPTKGDEPGNSTLPVHPSDSPQECGTTGVGGVHFPHQHRGSEIILLPSVDVLPGEFALLLEFLCDMCHLRL